MRFRVYDTTISLSALRRIWLINPIESLTATTRRWVCYLDFVLFFLHDSLLRFDVFLRYSMRDDNVSLDSINKNVLVKILVYRMDRNQITAIIARLWRREASQAALNTVALRHPRRRPRRSFHTVSIGILQVLPQNSICNTFLRIKY